MARNKLVQQFLASEATDLIFLDADISWEPWSLTQLLKHDVGIVAGVYPFKNDIENYPVFLKESRVDKDGLINVHYAPTGFMRIKREVFEKFEAHYHNILIEEWRDGKKQDEYLNFFDCRYDTENKRWYGEDVNFCYLLSPTGNDIFVINGNSLGYCRLFRIY